MVKTDALVSLRVELLGGLLVDPSRIGNGTRGSCSGCGCARKEWTCCAYRCPLAAVGGWIPEVALAEPDDDPSAHLSTVLLAVEVIVTSQTEDRRKALVYGGWRHGVLARPVAPLHARTDRRVETAQVALGCAGELDAPERVAHLSADRPA